MEKQILPAGSAPHDHPSGDLLPSVSGVEFWRLLAPWLGYLITGSVGIAGLYAGSRMSDPGGHGAGVLCFFLAVASIAWRIHRQTGGADEGVLLKLQVNSSDELLLYVAVFAILGVGGLALAGAAGGVFRFVGLTFFVCCVALVFFYVKAYFDQAETAAVSGLTEAAGQREEGSH